MSKKMTTFEDLSPEQQRVVSEWGRGLAVMAGAGSGKTTTLVIKCAELLKKNPEAQFAAVSFTEKSANDLRAKLTERLSVEGKIGGEAEVLKGHWVTTIHGLCGSVLREFPREAGFDGEESMLSEGEAQRLWERAIEQLWADETPEPVETALEKLLNRENRSTLTDLLRRTRDLYAIGILDSLRDNDDASRALAVLSEFVVERYDRLKRRRGALDFNDLERGADRALEHAHVRQAFQKRFQLVLVDEFQDTNPLQAKIILRFVKPNFSNLCVVGDPKQSIYRFRDADVSVFEEFCERLPLKLSLTWNFRSRPGIIEFTNGVCARAFAASKTMPMRYEALTSKRPVSEKFSPVNRLDVKGPHDLALWIQAEVKKGVPLEDMALLLRKIRGNEKWLRALTSAGIQIAVGSGGLFWEDPRVRELVSFLKWWAYPENTYSAAVFFRAPWVGVPDLELDQWFGKKVQDPREYFFSEKHLNAATTSGALARELSLFRGKIVRPSELLLKLLVTSEIEDEIGAQLLGLWHRVEEFSSTGLAFHEVVTEISRAVEESRREREVAPPRNEGLLPVLTFHGAKGLEFKHVILIDFGQKTRAHNAPLLYWDRHEGAYLAAKDEMGERVKDPVEEEWKKREREKDLAESKRIFYVALTRAEERLILVCPEIFDRKGEPVTFDPEEVYSQDFWRGWVECGPKIESLKIPEKVVSSQIALPLSTRPDFYRLDPKLYIPKRPRHSVTEWNLLSRCPRAYEWTYVRPRFSQQGSAGALAQKQTAPSVSDESGISQRELGTRVHACLETSDFEGLRALQLEAGEDRFQAEKVIDWAENSPLMKGKAWSELAFEIPVSGEILVGSMDRVVQEGEGAFQVVDFKVTRKAKSSDELLDAYQTQMELYVWALAEITKTPNVKSLLVNFSESGVEEVSVNALSGSDRARKLASSAAKIVEGEIAVPTPGKLCLLCQFRSICPEGQNYVEKSS
jgi:ATP-dependent helicase/nuclease subunit A